jgi:imidazoleglycerol-phosphate dehydratase
MNAARQAKVERNTFETQISIGLNLDAPLEGGISTGHGFLDHMLDAFKRHARIGLIVAATGDLHVDTHHLIEDCGITLGMAFAQALTDKIGLERYGTAFVPMDETLAHVVLDFSGRAHLEFRPEELNVIGEANGFNIFHLREFLRGFCNHAGVTLHVRVLSGREAHHVIEAIVKALARALFAATRVTHSEMPSTKGSL